MRARSGTKARYLLVFPIGVSLWLLFSALAQPFPSDDPAGNKLFIEHIRPLLEKQCLACHNDQSKQAGLDLSTREGLLRGGDRGPAIVPGDPQNSLLYKLVGYQREPAMPYKGSKLPDEVVAQLADWIKLGAPYPESLTAAGARASMPASPPEQHAMTLFSGQVRPVLEKQCVKCHGGGAVKRSGFDLSTRESLLRGGENGPAVIPGNAQASSLYKRIKYLVEPGMPFQGDKLSDDVIAQIAEWINAGAPYDRPLGAGATPGQTVAQPGSDHWAFKSPQLPPVPAVRNQEWVQNPIDAFIGAEHEKRGLRPVPPADKLVLLRRVYLDLIGVPPTPDQMHAFLADRSKDAYEKVVDRLLASPHYGERWGRHWMDVWRYSDGGGFAGRLDYSQTHIWHWRDWIVESLNQDKGYDQMILEMLAGDEIAPSDPQVLRATGYLARDYYRFNRNSWLQETVDHTAMAFLGLTLKCARCHEHKYDPISQEEYYRFRAFFERYDVRADRVPGQPDLTKDSLPRIYDAEPRAAQGPVEQNIPAIFAQTYRFVRGDEDHPDTTKALDPGVPQILGNYKFNIQPVNLPFGTYNPDLRPFVQHDLVVQAHEEIEKVQAALAKANRAVAEARRQLAQAPAALHPKPNSASSSAADEARASDTFKKEIKPIFQKNCFGCHDAQRGRSGLVLETMESVLRGGDKSGPAAIPGRSKESPLILYVRGQGKPRMPMSKAPLSEADITRIAKWIDQLPQDDPDTKLRKAEAAQALAEKHLASVQAALPALEARIAADRARYASPPDDRLESLTHEAEKAERQAGIMKAEENLLDAQQQLTAALAASDPGKDETKDKRAAAAREKLAAAVAALTKPTDGYTPVAKPYPSVSTGRRLALARWIVSPDTPLTARVAINHLWLHHFGKPLVPTVANFGLSGKPPSNPELLDWLAVQLMQHQWSMKYIHRMIVTSATYKMESAVRTADAPNVAIDPENRYLWRMNSQRMDAETVRDSVLYVAGQLDSRMGGPPVDERDSPDSRRRGIYFYQTHESEDQFLRMFDAANPNECYARTESIVPQQALAMADSKLTLAESRQLARRLSQELAQDANPADFVTAAFETVLNRPPSREEISLSEEFLARQTDLFRTPAKLTAFTTGPAADLKPAAQPDRRAREDLIHVLLNHNEFVTIR